MILGRKQHETGLHIGIVHALRLDFLPEDLIFFHVANGGVRHKAEAIKLKKMGVLAGVADLLCHWPTAIQEDGKKSLWMETGYIEIKTDSGDLADTQEAFRDRIKALGGKYAIARSYEAVRDILVGWGCRCQYRVHFNDSSDAIGKNISVAPAFSMSDTSPTSQLHQTSGDR